MSTSKPSTPRIEVLAGRVYLAGEVAIALPAGIATIDNHRRLIVTTTDVAERYMISQTSKRIYVTDVDAGAQDSFLNRKVRKIVVHLNDGDDHLTLQTSTPVLARGDYGNDTLLGGDEHDDLFGDYGNDSLVGGAGNDLLEGNAGADVLVASLGSDTLFGGVGRDRLYASEGTPDAADVVNGGKGRSIDRLFVSADDDAVIDSFDVHTVS